MNRYSADNDPHEERRVILSWWRLGITLLVAVLICGLGALIVTNMTLSRDLQIANERLRDLGASVDRQDQDAEEKIRSLTDEIRTARETALKTDDLEKLRNELETSLGSTAIRVKELENRTRSLEEVFASASQSILFLQGSYQLIDPETEKPLRYLVDKRGARVMIAEELPMLAPDGNGPVYEPIFTGTGFVISPDGLVITNRHVALPWEQSQFSSVLISRGIVPKLTRLWGYLPGTEAPFKMSMVRASDSADLALLRCDGVTDTVPSLALAEKPAVPGSEVIVMGYPTGLRALLARAGDVYREESREEGVDSYWQMAQRLSEDGLIQPLASRGIVGQTSAAHIVYDAETTSGGSGGPVLNLNGQVVAVNTAVLPDFDGSNLGVPARAVIELVQTSRDATQ